MEYLIFKFFSRGKTQDRLYIYISVLINVTGQGGGRLVMNLTIIWTSSESCPSSGKYFWKMTDLYINLVINHFQLVLWDVAEFEDVLFFLLNTVKFNVFEPDMFGW